MPTSSRSVDVPRKSTVHWRPPTGARTSEHGEGLRSGDTDSPHHGDIVSGISKTLQGQPAALQAPQRLADAWQETRPVWTCDNSELRRRTVVSSIMGIVKLAFVVTVAQRVMQRLWAVSVA